MTIEREVAPTPNQQIKALAARIVELECQVIELERQLHAQQLSHASVLFEQKNGQPGV